MVVRTAGDRYARFRHNKRLYEALLGCREGDYVESYMTYNMAYGDINFSTIPKESPVAYFLR
ncbi:MAG: hypothetical protein ACLRMJ_08855 [Alistipes finegoldii]